MDEARTLIEHPDADVITAWEFGNEPHDSSSPDLASKFAQVRKILASRFANSTGGRPKLLGPDGPYPGWAHARPSVGRYTDFFKASGVDGATIHLYPFDHNDVGGDDKG